MGIKENPYPFELNPFIAPSPFELNPKNPSNREREREGERAVPKQRWSWNARAGVSVEIARSEEIALSEEIAQSKAHSEKKAPKRAGKETGRRGGK
jgi:hypothetical protein